MASFIHRGLHFKNAELVQELAASIPLECGRTSNSVELPGRALGEFAITSRKKASASQPQVNRVHYLSYNSTKEKCLMIGNQ